MILKDRQRVGRNWFKRSAKNLTLLVASVIATLLLVEVVFFFCGISYSRRTRADYYRGNAGLPSAEWENTKEGQAHVKLNNEGFRDKKRVEQKSADTIRVAVLGDSYVHADQVPVRQRFTELLEESLNTSGAFGKSEVEVLNFGCSGYGTAQELMTLRHYVWKYDPDIVLLCFLPHNDIRNNYEPLEGDASRPYFVLQEGELVLDDSFRDTSGSNKSWLKKVGYEIIDRSRLAQLAYYVRRQLQDRKASSERAIRSQKFTGSQDSSELGLDDYVFRAPDHADWQSAWHVTEAIIKKMAIEVDERGVDFLVATLTSGIQVHPDAKTRAGFCRQLEVSHLIYPDERIHELGERERIHVVNLCHPFLALAEEKNIFLHGFANTKKGTGHWNADGNRLAAEILSSTIIELFAENFGASL